jgi:hypothetical protein
VTGKAFYIDNNLSGAPVTGVNTLNIIPACQYILWQWIFTGVGSGEQQVAGFHLFEVDGDGQLLSAIFEFNSVAWGADLGYHTLFPGQNCVGDPIPPSKKRAVFA